MGEAESGGASDPYPARDARGEGRAYPQPPKTRPKRQKSPLKCPECGGERLFRDGLRRLVDGSKTQRWLCRECGYRFSEKRLEKAVGKDLKSGSALSFNRRVCAPEVGVENSAGAVKALEEKTRGESWAAGATEDLKGAEGDLVNFAWWLKKQGRANSTIQTYNKALRYLIKAGANLKDPESVKETLARVSSGDSWRALLIDAYTRFLKMHGASWEPPASKAVRKLPFIPTEEEIDSLIASCGRKMAALLQTLKETGMRIGEATRLRWVDVDLERRLIMLNEPEKRGAPRIFKISEKLAMMLGSLQKRGERIFPSVGSVRVLYFRARARAAVKLQNPRLKRINLHTFRHWKATMEYHRTKDILHVKQLLGHRTLDTTTLYIQIEDALFSKTSDEFHSAVAKTIDEAKGLVEAGFEYVCTFDNMMLFRKRK